MQIDKLKVMANVSEQYYPVVKVGQKVDITVDIFPGETFEGKVTRINPALDAQTRTFGVEITIPNSNERLRPGMFARATFHLGEIEGVMVDDVAVQKQAGSAERFVYVIKDGVAELRFVRDGRRVGKKVSIVEGLEAGEQVATTSFVRLMDGKAVEVVAE
jgi:RND family efflux transporter MFP subunit